MKYFLDTEFHEYKQRGYTDTIELISIGIVREDGQELYCISREFSWWDAYANHWLRLNVLKPIYEDLTAAIDDPDWQKDNRVDEMLNKFAPVVTKQGSTLAEIRAAVLSFVGDDPKPEFYGYYADYDWVVFCWLFGRMINLPDTYPMYCRDLKQMVDEYVEREAISLEEFKSREDYPQQANEHNALDDARWNRRLHAVLNWAQ